MKRFSWFSLEPLLTTFLLLVLVSIGIPIWEQNKRPDLPVTLTPNGTSTATMPETLLELPLGGRKIIPDYRLVALYGTPGSPALGVLGEQDVSSSIERIKSLAQIYQTLSTEKIMPCFEIIATIASGNPTADGNYSREIDPAKLKPWIDAARRAEVYVILDLQPGRTDFLTQAMIYKDLLKQPNVGLALDPEWRLRPDQVHLKQVGTVGADEVNRVAEWLVDLTKENKLPQKVFLLHQFKRVMLEDRDKINVSHPELAYIIQMDGQVSQPSKQNTWRFIREGAQPEFYFGWKNFQKKDSPMLTPEQTMRQVDPAPWYISYQ